MLMMTKETEKNNNDIDIKFIEILMESGWRIKEQEEKENCIISILESMNGKYHLKVKFNKKSEKATRTWLESDIPARTAGFVSGIWHALEVINKKRK